jgi:hypothetical protein
LLCFHCVCPFQRTVVCVSYECIIPSNWRIVNPYRGQFRNFRKAG